MDDGAVSSHTSLYLIHDITKYEVVYCILYRYTKYVLLKVGARNNFSSFPAGNWQKAKQQQQQFFASVGLSALKKKPFVVSLLVHSTVLQYLRHPGRSKRQRRNESRC